MSPDPITSLERWIRYSSERLQVRPEHLHETNAVMAQAALEQVRTLVDAAKAHTCPRGRWRPIIGGWVSVRNESLEAALSPFITEETESERSSE